MTGTAADFYYPFDAGTGQFSSEAQWRQMWAFLTPGVVKGVDNELEPFGDSSGLHIKIKSGQVNIKGHTGGKTAQFTTNDVASVAGLTAGLKRIDRYVARADFVNNVVEFDWITGSPNASPVEPALTQNTSVWEIPIARTKSLVSTDTTLAVGDVTDERTWTTPTIIPRAQIASEAFGTWTPVVGGAWTRNNGTVSGTYTKLGRLVVARFLYTIGTTDNAGTGLTIAGFPFAPVNINAKGDLNIRDISVPTDYPGRVNLDVGSTTATLLYTAEFAAPGGVFFSPITATAPFVWAVGDTFIGSIWYESAT